MNKLVKSRILAYLFDIALMFLFMQIIYILIPVQKEAFILTNDLNTMYDKVLTGLLPINDFVINYIKIMKPLDKMYSIYFLINIVYILIYFVIIPLLYDGQTFGKYLNHIKIVSSEQLTAKQLIMRNFLTTSLLYILVACSLIYLLSDFWYFIIVLILTLVQVSSLFISLFMIIYRQDKRGLQDILTKSKVVMVEKSE